MEDLESHIKRDYREKEEKFYRDRKKMIFNKLGEKRHLQIQSKQNTIQMYFALEVPEDLQMDIQTELSQNTLLLLSTDGTCKSPMQQEKVGLYL